MHKKGTVLIALLAAALPRLSAQAAEAFSHPESPHTAWWPFFTDVFRSLDVVGFGLLTLLVILIGMCLDLLHHLRITRLIPESVLAEVQEEMANGEYERALEISEKSDSLIGQVFAAGLSKTDYSFERMQEAVRGETAIQALVWRQWVGQFKIAAVIGVLLGLIGACINAMRFVADLAGRPNVGLALASSFEIRAVVFNIFAALIFGAAMSLVAIVGYSLCSSKLEKIILEVDRLGEELLDPFRPLPVPMEE